MAEFSRVNRPVKEAGAYYTRLAPWYDLLAASEKKFIRTGLRILDPQPDERILEIGSGTGFAQILISGKLDKGISIGLDLSEGMGDIARKRVNQAGIMAHVGLVCSDTLPIPFPAQSFDAIFSSFTLELFDTPLIPEVLSECRRVLKPEGRLVIVSLSKDQPLSWMGRLYEAFHNRFPDWADCRPIPVAYLIQAAGYRIKRSIYSSIWGIPVGIVIAN
jgi:demethylmenaquinone methyltransferase/2-methoxy-6-polyprenyl-1,4-benzoquinol methylase